MRKFQPLTREDVFIISWYSTVPEKEGEMALGKAEGVLPDNDMDEVNNALLGVNTDGQFKLGVVHSGVEHPESLLLSYVVGSNLQAVFAFTTPEAITIQQVMQLVNKAVADADADNDLPDLGWMD